MNMPVVCTFRVVHGPADQWLAKRGLDLLGSCATADQAVALAVTAAALVAPSEVILHNSAGGHQVVYSHP